MPYDYKKGKQDLLNILTSNVEVIESEKIPTADGEWTYANGIHAWVGAIFVDLRDSADFFKNADSITVAKVIRAYTSEAIQILNMSTLDREIGIRGDAVYGIFSVAQKTQVDEVISIAYYINTYMKMLNKLLVDNGYDEVRAGIGYAISKDLIIKAGKKGTGVNDRVWIGEALSEADRLSKVTNKGANYSRTNPIAISSTVFTNLNETNKKFFTNNSYHKCYFGDVYKTEFSDWIDGGMLL